MHNSAEKLINSFDVAMLEGGTFRTIKSGNKVAGTERRVNKSPVFPHYTKNKS